MKIEVDEDYGILIKEIFTGVSFESDSKEKFSICMRDSGFELKFAGEWFEAKNGTINKLSNS